MKTAHFAGWVAAECKCPYCGGETVGSNGSLFISDADLNGDIPALTCLECEKKSKVPTKVLKELGSKT